MALHLTAQREQMAAVAGQVTPLLFERAGFAHHPPGLGIAMGHALGHHAGQGRGVAPVGLAPPGERLRGEGQHRGPRRAQIALQAPAKAARLQPHRHRAPPRDQLRHQGHEVFARQRAQRQRRAQAELRDQAGSSLFEIGPEADRPPGRIGGAEPPPQRRKAFEDGRVGGFEFVGFHVEESGLIPFTRPRQRCPLSIASYL